MVATVNPLATDAGIQALENGGNAIDAAVAAALTLGVVDGHNSGIGGGCFILIRTAEGKRIAIDGREVAPAAATRDMYLRDGEAQPELSFTGALASGVPGAVATYDQAQRTFGRLKLADVLLPAAEIAEEGFKVDRVYASRLASTAKTLREFESSRAVLLKPDDTAYRQGEVLRQADLARTYRAIAREGTDWFYGGPFAEAVESWMKKNGGIMTAEDLARYRVKRREPITSTYHDYTIVGFPPPSSGGVHVAQILNVLENFDLKAMHEEDPVKFAHITAEAMKRAFADRAYWLGDPDFADVPRGLLDQKYADRLAQGIDPDRATKVEKAGTPPNAQSDLFGKHTTHIAAADSEGNWVAITATINTSFGSKVIIPGTGVIMNNEMDDFSILPGVPNAFGLIGAEANAVAPGKRPLSSMSPTIVLKDDRPVLTLGAGGGPKIITQVILAALHHLDAELDLESAIARPRWHHQWSPDVLYVEHTMPEGTVKALEQRGHTIEKIRYSGVTQAIGLARDGNGFIGVHDPRVPGKAGGY